MKLSLAHHWLINVPKAEISHRISARILKRLPFLSVVKAALKERNQEGIGYRMCHFVMKNTEIFFT